MPHESWQRWQFRRWSARRSSPAEEQCNLQSATRRADPATLSQPQRGSTNGQGMRRSRALVPHDPTHNPARASSSVATTRAFCNISSAPAVGTCLLIGESARSTQAPNWLIPMFFMARAAPNRCYRE